MYPDAAFYFEQLEWRAKLRTHEVQFEPYLLNVTRTHPLRDAFTRLHAACHSLEIEVGR